MSLVLNVFGKLLGLAVLLGASVLLYDLASSSEFRITRVSVSGNRLLAGDELEQAAAVGSLNIFWVRRSELSQRLEQLPPIESALVSLELPDHLRIEVKERDPVAIWLTGDTPFLVDADGLVLAARSAGRPMLVIRDTASQTLTSGSRVNADVVRTVVKLEPLLTEALGARLRHYEYSPESGLNVLQEPGPRLILGNGDDLNWKVMAIQAITRHLESTRTKADLIDARFGDRPYFR